MLIQRLLIFHLYYQRAHCCFDDMKRLWSKTCFFFFFPVVVGLEGEGHWWCECPALRQREQSFSPHLVPGDNGQCIFSRCAWQSVPHWLNYPAVLVTSTPLFTQMKPQRIDWSDERGNGVGPSCLFLDLVGGFIALCSPFPSRVSFPALTSSNNSYGSWFHINDNKISSDKCLGWYYIWCLGEIHWVPLHLITVEHIMTLIWKSSFLGPCFVHPLNARLVYLSSFHFSTQLLRSLQRGNTDKHFKKCMLLGHLIDHRLPNSILPLQVALAPRQAELFNLFLSLSPCTQVTMFKQAESWFKVHNDISCRPSSPK